MNQSSIAAHTAIVSASTGVALNKSEVDSLYLYITQLETQLERISQRAITVAEHPKDPYWKELLLNQIQAVTA